jgi:ribonuclease E
MDIASKKIIVDANFPSETRVVLLGSKNNIEEIKSEGLHKPQHKGNIYLAKITRIEPSLQAIFIEYGGEKSGFLPFVEVHPDYYNPNTSDPKSFIKLWEEINPPKITNEDLKEAQVDVESLNIADKEEIDIEAIKRLVEEKIEPEFDLGAEENEVETIEQKDNQDVRAKIQDVLKKGQILLVQLTKEERGNKGASFTTYLSLAGKYCVLMPNKAAHYGISRKILNIAERKRLKNIISGLSEYTKTASLIARTAAIGHTTLEIKRDYEYLARLWNKIRLATEKSHSPCFIHQEEDVIQKVIRDMCDRHVEEVIIQGTSAYQKAVKFIQDISPADANKVKEYKDKAPIFTKFEVEEQLMKLYQPIVHLTSGGYIVINPTEALISIDVNSGKSTSERNIEETALKTNLEAAKEIARQVRLRGLSGLIVIDFIDMQEIKNRKIVERSFREFLGLDKAKIQTSFISNFGLLEMSRQRMQSSFLETHTAICQHCSGKGLVRADESNAMLILRTIENEIFIDSVEVSIVNIYANGGAVIYLLNNKRAEISSIEERYKIKLNFHIDPLATSDSYSLEKVKHTDKIPHASVASQENNLKERDRPKQSNQRKRENRKAADPIRNEEPTKLQPETVDSSEIAIVEERIEETIEPQIENVEIANEATDLAAVKHVSRNRYKHVRKKRHKINKNTIAEKDDEAADRKKAAL